MVAHGTYLVGDVALVAESDVPLLLQDHVFRLRLRENSGVHPYLALAALSTRFVRRQVRCRQFSAEIIDKIGERNLNLQLPIPRDSRIQDSVIEKVSAVLQRHAEVRLGITEAKTLQRAPGPRAPTHYGFGLPRAQLTSRVLIPRYYDPDLELALAAIEKESGERWVTVGELVAQGLLTVSSGVEVGKMAYGTGSVPFIRTSDLVDWEVYRDPTQGVSQEIYSKYSGKGSLQRDDLILVRDGTYLVGASALVLEEDLPALFCGGLLRLRTLKNDVLSPSSLLGLLNLPLARRQMRSRQFTRDVIDTLGPRLREVRLPPPLSETAMAMENQVESVMSKKREIKTLIKESIDLLEPAVPPSALGRPGWSMR